MSLLTADRHKVALASVPAALLLTYIPHFAKIAVWRGGLAKYPIASPREAALERQSSFVQRCAGCHQNGIETFPIFATAVIAAKVYKGNGAKVSNVSRH
jgi:uncharacterized MAPEG superfamily protein